MPTVKGPFAMRAPDGTLWPYTIADDKDRCWALAYDHMGEAFCARYWKRWEASIAAARRNGYRIVPVDVVERKAKHARNR